MFVYFVWLPREAKQKSNEAKTLRSKRLAAPAGAIQPCPLIAHDRLFHTGIPLCPHLPMTSSARRLEHLAEIPAEFTRRQF